MFSSLLITTKLKELCSNYPSTMFLTNAKKKVSFDLSSIWKTAFPSSLSQAGWAIFGQPSYQKLNQANKICRNMFNTYTYLFGRSSCSASKLRASNNMGLCENVIVDGSTEIFWLLADSFDWHSWVKFGDRS